MKQRTRTNPRLGPLVIKAQIESNGEPRDGYLTNISIGGSFVAMERPPAIDTEIVIRAVFPWKLGAFRARAHVVWRNVTATPDGRIAGAGVKFTDLEARSEQLLTRYLERFTALASQLEESAGSDQAH